jgi:hypothetical protein
MGCTFCNRSTINTRAFLGGDRVMLVSRLVLLGPSHTHTLLAIQRWLGSLLEDPKRGVVFALRMSGTHG